MFHKNSQYSRSYSKNEFCKILNPDWRLVYNQIEVFCKRSVQSYFRCSRLWWILVECDSKQSTPFPLSCFFPWLVITNSSFERPWPQTLVFFFPPLSIDAIVPTKAGLDNWFVHDFLKSAKFQVNQVSSSSPLNNAQTKPCTWSKATVTGRFSITAKSHHY